MRLATSGLLASAAPCAVAAPGSWSALALTLAGESWERVERAHATELRAPIARALAGVRTRATRRNPDGVSRGALIRACGRHHAVMRGAEVGVEPRQCRQRPCPACARARARQNGNDLVNAMQSRAGVAFVFATLTQRKLPVAHEGARTAVNRIYRAWRTLVNGRKHRDDFRRMFAGGLRTTETTWSPAGADRAHGGIVQYDGFHAHLHVMLEVNEGVARRDAMLWLADAWLDVVPDADHSAQRVLAARPVEHAHQLCKYVTKPLEEHSDDPGIVRALFGGLHGLRLLQAFGSWVAHDGVGGWRSWAGGDDDDDAPPLPARRGPEIGDLLRVVSKPIEGSTGRVPFVGAEPSDVVWVDAREAWTMVEAAIRARAQVRAAAKPPPC